jgi:hypothetical protein
MLVKETLRAIVAQQPEFNGKKFLRSNGEEN